MSHDPTGDSTDPDEEAGEGVDVQQNMKGTEPLILTILQALYWLEEHGGVGGW